MMKAFLFIFLLAISFVSAQSGLEVSMPIIRIVDTGSVINQEISVLGYGNDIVVLENSPNDFFTLDRQELILGEEGSGTFNVVIDGQNLNDGVYSGEIYLTSKDGSISIPVIYELESFSPAFDVVIEKYEVIDGANVVLSADVKFHQLKETNSEARIDYYVTNLRGEIVSRDSQVISIDRQSQIKKELILPDTENTYLFYVLIQDREGISTGTSSVLVSQTKLDLSPPESKPNYYFFITVGIIVILIITFMVFNRYWNTRLIEDATHWSARLEELKRVKFGSVARRIRKLQYQMNALERAYSGGYIKRESYLEGKRQINRMIVGLKKRL